jgi:hypothetical protein
MAHPIEPYTGGPDGIKRGKPMSPGSLSVPLSLLLDSLDVSFSACHVLPALMD